jgi:hypothetical protein
MVISKCRDTGNHVFFCADVNPERLPRSFGLFTSSYCPFCDASHFWNIEDTRLARRASEKASRVRRAS